MGLTVLEFVCVPRSQSLLVEAPSLEISLCGFSWSLATESPVASRRARRTVAVDCGRGKAVGNAETFLLRATDRQEEPEGVISADSRGSSRDPNTSVIGAQGHQTQDRFPKWTVMMVSSL